MDKTPTLIVILPLMLCLLMVAAVVLGRRLALWQIATLGRKSEEGMSAIDGAVLGLLGLLLAFAFGMAGDHLQSRRNLIVNEANAIGTAWLRIACLPADEQPRMREDFRQYLQVRMQQPPGRGSPTEESILAAEAAGLRATIWQRAVAAQTGCVTPQAGALLIAALNTMFDAATSRLAAANNHLPLPILWVLMGVAVVASLLAGIAMGGAPRVNWPTTLIFAATVSLTVWAIIDLELPRHGLIRVDTYDQLLEDLRTDFQQAG
jgi:hypothetical protein